MKAAETAVACRLVACKGFRWMEGMKPVTDEITSGYRLLLSYEPGGDDGDAEPVEIMGLPFVEEAPAWGWPAPASGWLPDLIDPATLGCLLALVRDAWRDPGAHVEPVGDHGRLRWRCLVLPPGDAPFHERLTSFYEDTEAEALVAAMEGAP